MKVSVSIEDGVIVVERSPKNGFDFSSVDPNWRAVQWQSDHGWIEVHRGERIWLDDIDLVQPFIDMYQAQVPPPAPDPVETVPESITRRQCALQLLAMQIITLTETLALTKNGDVPAAIAAVFDAAVKNGTMTAEQRILAEIDLAAANYYRGNLLLSMMGLTPEQIDQFFIAAADL